MAKAESKEVPFGWCLTGHHKQCPERYTPHGATVARVCVCDCH